MKEKLQILPCTFKPKPEELFSSWLVRLAYAHHSKSHTFYRILFPKISIWNRDIDSSASDELLLRLTEITTNSYQTLFNTTLRSYEGTLYLKHNPNGRTKWILPYGVYHRKRKNFGLAFCPLCLKNDGLEPYFRKQWRLSFYTICTKCNVYLHEKCPQCNKPVTLFRQDLGNRNHIADTPISYCYNCKSNLAEASIMYAPVKRSREQKTLMRILREGWKEDVIYPHLFFEVLHQLLKILRQHGHPFSLLREDLALRKKISTKYFADIEKYDSFEELPIESRNLLVYLGLWLLTDFPNRLIQVLRYHGFTSSVLLRDFKNVPFWFEDVVRQNFFVSNTNRSFYGKIQRKIQGYNAVVAPIKGNVGGKRKYSDFICPNCNSNWIISNGFSRDVKQYKCRSCGKGIFSFVTLNSPTAIHAKTKFYKELGGEY